MSATGELLRMAAPLMTLLAALLVATRRRVVREFEMRGAADAATAIHISPGSPLKKWWLTRLHGAGVLRSSVDGRQWLDRTAWARYRVVRRRRALTVAGALLALLATLAALGVLRP